MGYNVEKKLKGQYNGECKAIREKKLNIWQPGTKMELNDEKKIILKNLVELFPLIGC